MPADPDFHVVLVAPEIPPNTGTTARLCAATDTRLHLVGPLGFHLDDRYLRRAGLDYWPHLDLRVVDGLDEVISDRGRDRLWSFSTRATRVYTAAQYRPGDALIFGP